MPQREIKNTSSFNLPTPDLRDAVGIAGLGLVTYGCWLVWPPLAFIVPGAILVVAAAWGR
jgi:hypothetical protein